MGYLFLIMAVAALLVLGFALGGGIYTLIALPFLLIGGAMFIARASAEETPQVVGQPTEPTGTPRAAPGTDGDTANERVGQTA